MSNPVCPFTIEDTKQQGSRWVLANFHTHTPGSRDYAKALLPGGNRSPRDIARGILEDCRREGVHIIAVTDHNSPSFVRVKGRDNKYVADPESESYYAMMRALVKSEPEKYGEILVLPGVEIGAENIHVLGLFPPSGDPGWDVLEIAAILSKGNCAPEFYGDHLKSCTDFSVAHAIDVIHERGGIAIPAHIDGASGFLAEETQKRLLKLIVSRPHLFAVEYLKDATRLKLEKLLSSTDWKDITQVREGRSIAWTQSSDAHFVRAFSPNQGGNGMPIGTKGRRTWLRLDPGALTFDAVEAALLDPENRVRVDSTRRPRGRQGAYCPRHPDRTYVRALHIDWGRNQEETLRFNEGINAVAGPRKSGKTARAQAFAVIGGTKKVLSTADPETCDENGDGGYTKLKSVDMLLERGCGTSKNSVWWLHREADDRIYAARVEAHGSQLRTYHGAHGHWVDLYPNGMFDYRALRNHFQNLPALHARLAPAIPQTFSLSDMKGMLADTVRSARFIEWHYVPDELIAEHRKLHVKLRRVTLHPGSMSAAILSKELKKLFADLQAPRQKARIALVALYKNSSVGLSVSFRRGNWTDPAARKKVAEKLLAMQNREPDAVFEALKSIEDRATVRLELRGKVPAHMKIPEERINIALRGMLLVIGARDLGPIVLDAPGIYFDPVALVDTLAPLLLKARDIGAQFVVAVDDTNLPFAVDADLMFVCRRDMREGRIGPLDIDATGGLEKSATATWALKNLDGGGDQFSRRMQLYSGVLGADLAERQKKLADVVLALGNPRGRRGPRGK